MLETEFLGNSVREYMQAGGIFAVVFLALLLVRRGILNRIRRWVSGARGENLFVSLLDQIRLPESLLIALYFAARRLEVPERLSRDLTVLLIVVLTWRVLRVLQDITSFAVRRAVVSESASLAERETARNIAYFTNTLIFIAGALFVLDTVGVRVSALLTGLGIGGVAVALAAQAVLGDVFSAVAIFLDKPFVVGDSIIVDTLQGTVEHIGMKTTRVRALSGEMIIFPNSMLTSSKIRNFRHLEARRIVFTFGVSRQTPPEKVKKIGGWLKDIFGRMGHARLERAHLKEIGEASLNFEVVYYVLDPDYNKYMDLNEAVHLALLETFKKEGVELAYPTHVVLNA